MLTNNYNITQAKKLINSYLAANIADDSLIFGDPKISTLGKIINININVLNLTNKDKILDSTVHALSSIFSTILKNTSININLSVVSHPHMDCNILSKYISYMLSKNNFHNLDNSLKSGTKIINPNRCSKNITVDSTSIPNGILGIACNINGRMINSNLGVPSKNSHLTLGSFPSNSNKFNSQKSFVNKNGLYTVKVHTSYIINNYEN